MLGEFGILMGHDATWRSFLLEETFFWYGEWISDISKTT